MRFDVVLVAGLAALTVITVATQRGPAPIAVSTPQAGQTTVPDWGDQVNAFRAHNREVQKAEKWGSLQRRLIKLSDDRKLIASAYGSNSSDAQNVEADMRATEAAMRKIGTPKVPVPYIESSQKVCKCVCGPPKLGGCPTSGLLVPPQF